LSQSAHFGFALSDFGSNLRIQKVGKGNGDQNENNGDHDQEFEESEPLPVKPIQRGVSKHEKTSSRNPSPLKGLTYLYHRAGSDRNKFFYRQ
jgi:hypothetical protein